MTEPRPALGDEPAAPTEPVGIFAGFDVRADPRIPPHLMVVGPAAFIEQALAPVRAAGPGDDRERWLADALAALRTARAEHPPNTFAIVEITRLDSDDDTSEPAASTSGRRRSGGPTPTDPPAV